MDAYYASVEQRDAPELKGKPVAVGGSKERGVVAAASYEARKYGVHSAMPSAIAYRKCPGLIFIKPRFDIYKSVSQQIRAIFYEYTDLVEPLSLDEAYLDVTLNKKQMPSATLIAREIKQRIKAETNLTASAGVSINKFLAKVASDIQKPDGLTLIPPDKAVEFVAQLEIEKFHGIGKVTAKKMHDLGIKNGADLKQWQEADLVKYFGKAGRYYYTISRAIDHRKVEPNRIQKSIGAENTFDVDLSHIDDMLHELDIIAVIVLERMLKADSFGKTLTLKVRFQDFTKITRSKTVDYAIDNNDKMRNLMHELLQSLPEKDRKVRLLGLTVSNLIQEEEEDKINSGLQLTIDF